MPPSLVSPLVPSFHASPQNLWQGEPNKTRLSRKIAGFDAVELGLAMGLIRGLRLRIEGARDGYDYLHFAAYFFAFPYLVPRSIFLPLRF